MSTLLTTKDVQELINVDKSTIYRMAEDGRIPAIKVGRQWRFPARDIQAWLGASSIGEATTDLAEPEGLGALLGRDALQAIADLMGHSYGVMAVITDMEGNQLTEMANPCGLFEAVGDKPRAISECVAGWRRLGAAGGIEPRFIPSHLGFLCARTFIRIGTELVGMVIVGGVAPPTWPPSEDFLALTAESIDISLDELKAHLHEIYHLDADEKRRVLIALPKIADLISVLAAERGRLMSKLDQIAALARSANTNQRSNP